MTLQRIFSGLIFVGATCAVHAQTPSSLKYDGSIWANLYHGERFGQDTTAFEVRRALLGVETTVAPEWTIRGAFKGASNSGVEIDDAYIQYLSTETKNLKLRFGRSKLPYYDFVEKKYASRWTGIGVGAGAYAGGAQTESRSFSLYRDEGASVDFAANENLHVAAMIRNGADNSVAGVGQDADLAWNASVAWTLNPTVQMQAMLDIQGRSEPLATPARKTLAVSMGLKDTHAAGLAEVNYQAIDPGGDVEKTDKMGFGVHGQYSLANGIDGAQDRGLHFALLSGSKTYKTEFAESLLVSFGLYRKLSPQLRSMLQVVLVQGVDDVDNSDGTYFAWNWEAKF